MGWTEQEFNNQRMSFVFDLFTYFKEINKIEEKNARGFKSKHNNISSR